MPSPLTSFRCDPCTRRKIEKKAQRQGTSVSHVVRTAMREHLDDDDTDDTDDE